ncbi:hypothetical protein [Ruminococcus albus]|uniref:hypothetical protein n=1 Tax=Ruminococcus albus TaxID=1264 RepID=UPI0004B5B1CF|nr:hypothetical protein [Ruminococcus albus]
MLKSIRESATEELDNEPVYLNRSDVSAGIAGQQQTGVNLTVNKRQYRKTAWNA